MENVRFSNSNLTEEDIRSLLNIFKDPVTTKGFLQLLEKVKLQVEADLDKTAKVYLMNDDPTTRALALQLKGRVEILQEFSALIKTVVK